MMGSWFLVMHNSLIVGYVTSFVLYFDVCGFELLLCGRVRFSGLLCYETCVFDTVLKVLWRWSSLGAFMVLC